MSNTLGKSPSASGGEPHYSDLIRTYKGCVGRGVPFLDRLILPARYLLRLVGEKSPKHPKATSCRYPSHSSCAWLRWRRPTTSLHRCPLLSDTSAMAGSVGATVRIYMEKYEPEVSKQGLMTADVLRPLVDIGLKISRLEHFTGRASPTVVT